MAASSRASSMPASRSPRCRGHDDHEWWLERLGFMVPLQARQAYTLGSAA